MRAKIDMWLTPKLILECTPNFNCSANSKHNENDQDNENHPDNENEVNYAANKYILKASNRSSSVFMISFEHILHLVLAL